MRTNFIEELTLLARKNQDIFLIVGDLGFSVVERFAAEFPDRFINAGIAEQNMTGMAAGLASEGFHVFTYSIANFPTFRCAEQIRNDIAYHKLPVTVVAVGSGMSYGSLGYSHHAVQDYALMRSMPGMLIASPGDPMESRACLRYLCDNPQPSYLRLGKNGEKNIHPNVPTLNPATHLTILIHGKASAESCILCTGTAIEVATEAYQKMEQPNQWCLRSMPIWNDHYKQQVIQTLTSFKKTLIVEEHLESGGFGSFIRECVGNNPSLQSRISCVSINSAACGAVASQTALREIGGLTASRIISLTMENHETESL